jgi:hypothetical protein
MTLLKVQALPYKEWMCEEALYLTRHGFGDSSDKFVLYLSILFREKCAIHPFL